MAMYNSSLFASPFGLVLLLALAVGALYFGAGQIAAFLLLVLLLSASARLWSRGVLQKTGISIDDGQTACHAGESMNITLRIRSRSFFPLIWLDVVVPFGERLLLRAEGDAPDTRHAIPPEQQVTGLRERFAWLLWQQEIACSETLHAERRGVVDITHASLQAGDGFGLSACHRFAELDHPVRFAVYPRLMQADVRPLTRQLSDAEAGRRGQTEDMTLLKSSRPYQHGDPMKRINWRYLAMSGRMEVNQYELITPGCITFVLDLFSFRYVETYTTAQDTRETRVVLRDQPLETMISVIASCIRTLSEQGMRFALIIPGYGQREPVLLPPGSGDIADEQAMEALAAIDYRGEPALLPHDEIRRLRRRFGVTQLCAWSSVPSLAAELEALGLSRMRVIACQPRGSAQTTETLDALLAGDLIAGLPICADQEGGAA
ncbi:MAG: DUF58 domain-containing protein [Clostridia bacterium]|nr:DUF58 domain-containing protein [Clostridia bacterium]MBQ7053030.1 DUF58 domain-containing protein [Clostridia bacterium]